VTKVYNIYNIVKDILILYYITIVATHNSQITNHNTYPIMSTSFNNRKPYSSSSISTTTSTSSKRELPDSSTSLSFDEQNEILRNFPSTVKFSYEKSTHKKVLSDVYVIIPKGKKYFAWFTHRNRKNICIFLEVGYQNKIMNIFYRHVSFDDVLSYGTIFYGTLFRTRPESGEKKNIYSNEIFSVEDIFYYKGDDISDYSYHDKLKVVKNIFDTKLNYNMSFCNNGIVFGLPVMTTDFTEAYDKAMVLPYSVYSIQYKYFEEKKTYQSITEFYHFSNNSMVGNNVNSVNGVNGVNGSNNSSNDNSENYATHTSKYDEKPGAYIEPIKQKTASNEIYKTFFIKPDLQNDIYYLYQNSTTNFDVISKDIAHIPDYKTSVLMNKLFRNIKENSNLDSLEESDEEDEFENIQIDKFVDLNKIIKMRCIFNYKFKKWVPVSVI